MARSSALRSQADDLLRRLPPARRQRWALARSQLRSLARDGRPHRVLDAGCGDGQLTLDLARRHRHWSFVGVDLSSTALTDAEHARRRLRVRNAAFAQADLTRLAVLDRVDVVLAMECLVEIQDDRAVVGRLAAALRPDGVLIAHVPAHDWRPVLPGSETTWRHEVRHGYDAASLRSRLAEAGLQVTSLRPTQRTVVTVAQEVRDRWKHAPRRLLPLAPVMAAAAWSDTAGATWGPARGWFVCASPSPATGA